MAVLNKERVHTKRIILEVKVNNINSNAYNICLKRSRRMLKIKNVLIEPSNFFVSIED